MIVFWHAFAVAFFVLSIRHFNLALESSKCISNEVPIEMHHRQHPDGSSGNIPEAPSIPVVKAEDAHLFLKLENSSNATKIAIASAIFCAIISSTMLLGASQKSEIFPYNQIGAGQVFAFIVCLSAIFCFVGLEIIARLSREPVVFKRTILSEESEHQLQAAAEFSTYMILFFVCDRTSLIPREKKHYDKDTFWFLWVCLVFGAMFTLRKAKPPTPKPAKPVAVTAAADGSEVAVSVQPAAPTPVVAEVFHVAHLQRDQTEEWKGWMQVMFLWYHYFEVKPIYNVIRLYIAAYVWMTGFGNFSYYYIRKDFSLARFLQMQWRLNFMVIWVCAILANEYMLYYICMLHTFFTMLIYAGLGLLPQYNVTAFGVTIKFVALGIISFLMWDVSENLFNMVWQPFTWLVQYHDPYNVQRPLLSEWYFRSYLDHFIWIVGMLCAFNHPRIDAWLQKIDTMPEKVGNLIKGAVVAVCLIVGYWYVDNVLLLPKKEYNNVHPYTSFIPIILFLVLRNISQTARMYHMHLFEFLGKTTLETYIAQFHIWMATTGINGSPKRLLRILPEGWPLLNFAATSVIFFYVSYRLFQTTNTIKTAILPAKATNATLKKNAVFFFSIVGGAFLIAVALTLHF